MQRTTPNKSKQTADAMSAKEIERRRDEAVRRALNTPPKLHKEMKKGKKRAGEPTPSEKRT